MTASDVIADVKKLIGLELHSVRPGADITIQEVDEGKDCLILSSKEGKIRSRPLSELRTIWSEMMKNPAVHVDGVLHGSGTSRNQPETILANLPYVEWLKVNNKKHIAYVGRNTHPYGTLKKMDAILASELSGKLTIVPSQNKVQMVSVTSDVVKATSDLQKCITGTVEALEPGIYIYKSTGIEVIIISNTKAALPIGCYTVIESSANTGMRTINICGKVYYVVCSNELKLLIQK